MQRDTKLAKLYVEAILELKLGRELVDSFYLQFRVCGAILSRDEQVWKFFTSPIIPWQKKAQLLEAVFRPKMNRDLVSFLITLAKRNRFTELFTIQSLLRKAVNEHLGQRTALVYSAQELQEGEAKRLGSALERYFGKNIILQKLIKEELLGGMELRSGDLVLNASLQSRLKGMQKALLERKVTGEQYYEN